MIQANSTMTHRNVLILHTDAQMWSWLGKLSGGQFFTPHLDALAATSVHFRQAHACSGVCVPSRAALMTGRHPVATGVVSNNQVLPDSERTLGRYFSEAGYETAYFGKRHYGRDHHPAREDGWEHFFGKQDYDSVLVRAGIPHRYPEKSLPQTRARYWTLGASQIPEACYFETILANETLSFLDRRDQTRPFLCFLSMVAPHGPFTPPEPFASRFSPEKMLLAPRDAAELNGKHPATIRWIRQNQKYFNEGELREFLAMQAALMALADAQVGRVLAKLDDLGLAEETLVVFASDHGDFGTGYGMIGKSWAMLDPLLRIPLLMRLPGGRPGCVFDGMVENIDILPTVMEWANLPKDANIQGTSLVPILRGESCEGRKAVFAFNECEYSGGRVSFASIRLPRWRYTLASDGFEELYEAEEDPWHWRNLAGTKELVAEQAALGRELLRCMTNRAGSSFDRAAASFWEDETLFYDESRYTGERIAPRPASKRPHFM